MSVLLRNLLIVDVQEDFVEGGALAVAGGRGVAAAISAFLSEHAERYTTIIASRDWHNPGETNGGHFAARSAASGSGFGFKGDEVPNYDTTWPEHCVAGTPGAAYAPELNQDYITYRIKKGQGRPAYSMFEGTTDSGVALADLAMSTGCGRFDIVGIATDYCVLRTALDAARFGFSARVIVDLTAGVATASTAAALTEMHYRGIDLTTSKRAFPKGRR